MNFNKTGKVFTSKFVGTGPSSYKKRTYGAAVTIYGQLAARGPNPARGLNYSGPRQVSGLFSKIN
jgi:hypothetical protein